jgi:hypothetical protein
VASLAFRRSALIVLIMTASCAGDFVNHRLEYFPASEPSRLDVRDSSGAVIKAIDDPATIKAFDSAVNQIDRWFDDIFSASGALQYTVELVRNDDVSVGSLSIGAKYLHVPGKYAAKITQKEREQLLRILGLW